MTPAQTTKMNELSKAERIFEPKYGGKDHSGYDTLMKYEINEYLVEAFERGFTAAESLNAERCRVLVDALKFCLENYLDIPTPLADGMMTTGRIVACEALANFEGASDE